MKTNQTRAGQIAYEISQLESREDYGGRHIQLSMELAGEIFFGGKYQRADGRMVKSRDKAMESWIKANADAAK